MINGELHPDTLHRGAVMTAQEMRVCDPCWDARNDEVETHRCDASPWRDCDCPCGEIHGDLDTIDLDHDRGYYRDIWSGHIERY